jgi:cation transport ATPase
MHMGEPDMTDTAENKVTLKVEGMTCGHCVGRVQKALDAAPGVIIRFGAGADTAGLAEIVTEAGYPAQAA